MFSEASELWGGDHLLVVLDGALEFGDGVVVTDPEMGGDTVDETLVVRNQHHTAGEALHGVDQCVHGFHIEMIGRFIQNEEVGVQQTHAGKGNAGLLTSRQGADFLQPNHTRDAEATQVSAILLLRLAGEPCRHVADGSVVEVQLVDVMLGEEGEAKSSVAMDHSLQRLEFAGQQLQLQG